MTSSVDEVVKCNVHIHDPMPSNKYIKSGDCPDCKKRTRFIVFYTDYYGIDSTCMRCGREWQDGEWCALPFIRGIRRLNIEEAKKKFRRMAALDKLTEIGQEMGDYI